MLYKKKPTNIDITEAIAESNSINNTTTDSNMSDDVAMGGVGTKKGKKKATEGQFVFL